MNLKATFFRLRKAKLEAQKKNNISDNELARLWTPCPSCRELIYTSHLGKTLKVCPKCDHYFRMNSHERIEMLVDPESFVPHSENIQTADPLEFVDLKPYKDRITAARTDSGVSEAIQTGLAKINGFSVALGVMEFGFLGGSMGAVVGERIYRLCELALQHRYPLILISSSGGARMHEGLSSLLQMAKTSAAVAQLQREKLLFLSVLVDPTYGGVSASFAMLGDLIIAEKNAKIGFAGPRVIEETIKQKLPKDFQTAEYLLEHGQIDMVVPRPELKDRITQILRLHAVRTPS